MLQSFDSLEWSHPLLPSLGAQVLSQAPTHVDYE